VSEMADGDAAMVFDEAKGAMEKSLKSLRQELQKVRTGRASTALLDGIQVDYYGTPTPLNQLANLSSPDPRLIVISPYDKGAMSGIEKAILTSDLGLTPSNDGKVVRIPIPPLTEQRRKELVKHVHRLAEDHKVGVREARRDALAMLKDLEGEGAIPADDRRREEKRIQTLTDEYTKKIEETSGQKEQEILQV
jgi:ribosome recycling factor